MNRKKIIRLSVILFIGFAAFLIERRYIRDHFDSAPEKEADEMIMLDSSLVLENRTVVEGEILERSVLPDPGELDYPDCRYTIRLRGNAILSGKPCPKEIALVVDGVRNFRKTKTADLKPGDKVECHIIPFDTLPREAQSTQLADDLNLFMLERYYAVNVREIRYFKEIAHMPTSEIFFSEGNEEYVSIFDRHINPPIPEDIRQAQESAIRQDLDRMNLLLSGYDDAVIRETNRRFEKVWEEEKAKDPPGYNRVVDQDMRLVWRKIGHSFWCLPEDYTFLAKPDMLASETLDCFAALKDAFEANGIQFIVSLVPDFYVISSRVINREFRDVPDLQSAMFVRQLSEIGVETIYSSDAIVQNYDKYPHAFWYPSDPHPGDTAQDVLTGLVAERIKRYRIGETLDPSLFSTRTTAVTNKSIVFPDHCDIGENQPGAPFSGNRILYGEKPVPRSGDAPVLIIGNSFLQTPVSASDSYPSYLSWKTLSPVDWFVSYQYGFILDIPFRFLSDTRTFFNGKKVLIMQMATSNLCSVNKASLMRNLREYDSDLLLLNKKKCIVRYSLPGTEGKDHPGTRGETPVPEDRDLTVIGDRGEIAYSFDLRSPDRNETDDRKPAICVVPVLVGKGMSADISVNEQTKHLDPKRLSRSSAYCDLLFELPAGTRDVTIRIEGDPGTVFSIGDIRIWQ